MFVFFAYFYIVSRKDYVSVSIVILSPNADILSVHPSACDGPVLLPVRSELMDGLLIKQLGLEQPQADARVRNFPIRHNRPVQGTICFRQVPLAYLLWQLKKSLTQAK